MLAFALGGLAGWINTFQLSVLTPETPLFVFGRPLVLVAFLRLGPRAGLVAALTALSVRLLDVWQVGPGVAVGGVVYVLEALCAWYLYKRVRSLLLAVTIYWVTIGWILDLVIYVAWVGLTREYVVLLLVKQQVNGSSPAEGAWGREGPASTYKIVGLFLWTSDGHQVTHKSPVGPISRLISTFPVSPPPSARRRGGICAGPHTSPPMQYRSPKIFGSWGGSFSQISETPVPGTPLFHRR